MGPRGLLFTQPVLWGPMASCSPNLSLGGHECQLFTPMVCFAVWAIALSQAATWHIVITIALQFWIAAWAICCLDNYIPVQPATWHIVIAANIVVTTHMFVRCLGKFLRSQPTAS